ncbi:hypothetical protein MTO96_036637 [Rhipicephalus appendiculatus]
MDTTLVGLREYGDIDNVRACHHITLATCVSIITTSIRSRRRRYRWATATCVSSLGISTRHRSRCSSDSLLGVASGGGPLATTAATSGTPPVVRRLPAMAPLVVKGVMLSRQKELPKLPVPPLAETLERLWLSLMPILSVEQLQTSRKAIDKFGERGGEGEYLHRMLTYRYKRLDNWLDEWWLNTAYLDVRTPLPVHSSPAAIFPRQTFTSEEDFLLFAAKLTAALLEFKDLIDRQALPPPT